MSSLLVIQPAHKHVWIGQVIGILGMGARAYKWSYLLSYLRYQAVSVALQRLYRDINLTLSGLDGVTWNIDMYKPGLDLSRCWEYVAVGEGVSMEMFIMYQISF